MANLKLPKDSTKLKIATFVNEYVIDKDGPRAARAAGITPCKADHQARVWLRDDDITGQIAIRHDAIKRDSAISPEWVLTELKYQYNAAKADHDRPNAIKTLEMMAKHVGLFAPSQDKGGNVTVVIRNFADIEITKTIDGVGVEEIPE